MDHQKQGNGDSGSTSLWESPYFPTDDLDEEMWGNSGVPSPPPNDEDNKAEHDPLPQIPLLFSQSDDNQNQKLSDKSGKDDIDEEYDYDNVNLSDICWKLRSGLGKYSMTKSHWERRRLVLSGTKLLYYKLTKEEAAADKQTHKRQSSYSSIELSTSNDVDKNDSNGNKNNSMTTPPASPKRNSSSSWTKFLGSSPTPKSPTKDQEEKGEGPRDVLDIVAENASVEQDCTPGAPTAYEVDIKIKGEVKWKFCFESPEQGSKWLRALERVVMDDSREHGFVAGDHIIRWDMIVLPPVIWPIQIHGIVLDAGRNCVIIADFGLTSYVKQGNNYKDLASFDDDKEANKNLTDAYNNLFPKKKRLNVIVLTDPREIRQWTKVNYGGRFEMTPNGKKGSSKFDKMTFGLFRKSSTGDIDGGEGLDSKTELVEALRHIALVEGKSSTGTCIEGADDPKALVVSTNSQDIENGKEKEKNQCTDGSVRQPKSSKRLSFMDLEERDLPSPPPVFTLPKPPPAAQDDYKKLPKSDPTKIVLARTNFVLENEGFLPPYHVLFSNSECIAVWCKTGRWSTLQTAVWCHVTAVGNAKTSTGIALGVAAAHLFLVPIAAVGGALFVAAPLLLYHKSKEKWEEATNQLTEKFWERAQPEVFVEAIENWSGLKKKLPK